MTDEPVSVLMPVFNRDYCVGQAIKSIMDQSHERLELIIYDDGSTDNTREVINETADLDERISIIECNENKGVGYARNVLLDAATFHYACWQDSDDMSAVRRIEKQIQEIKNFSIVFTKWRWFIDDVDGFRKRDEKYSVDKATPTLMFPVDRDIRFDEDKKFGGEDWDWIKRMKKAYNNESEIDEVLYYLRFHNDRIGIVKRRMSEHERHLSYKQVVERLKEA